VRWQLAVPAPGPLAGRRDRRINVIATDPPRQRAQRHHIRQPAHGLLADHRHDHEAQWILRA
jgi:hypothetical protein